MKRIAYLALPLLLCVLVWGVKWRADHPTPTKLDLELRALMLKSPKVEFAYYPRIWTQSHREYYSEISKEELKQFADCFYLSGQPIITKRMVYEKPEGINVYSYTKNVKGYDVENVTININIKTRQGKVVVGDPNDQLEHSLHPVTTKRWLNLLLTHPKIGPELRRRMKQ